MGKYNGTWSLASIATLLAFIGGDRAAAARPPDPIDVGATSEGRLSIDRASVHDHRGHHSRGWRRALANVELVDPMAGAGRRLTRVDQVQDWDCSGRRYRVVRRIFRTDNGEYVRSEPAADGWASVAEGGAESNAFALVCPSAAQITKMSAAAVGPKEPERARSRSGAAVIWMPGSRRDTPEDAGRRR